jgi:hypothetical protein
MMDYLKITMSLSDQQTVSMVMANGANQIGGRRHPPNAVDKKAPPEKELSWAVTTTAPPPYVPLTKAIMIPLMSHSHCKNRGFIGHEYQINQ